MRVEPVAELGVNGLLNEGARLSIAELGLGLTLELRLGELDGDDSGQTLADVITSEIVIPVLEQTLLTSILIDQSGQRRAKSLLMGAALGGVDRIGIGVDRF